VKGGAERDATVGVNWYPDDNIRLMADYTRAHADPSASSVTGRKIDSDLFVGRLQVAW
jgi:phosphate-selective porin OprO/OprP